MTPDEMAALEMAIGFTQEIDEELSGGGIPICIECGHRISQHSIHGRFGPDECSGENSEHDVCNCRLFRGDDE